MHESPIARQLVNAAIAAAGSDQRMTTLHVRLGPDGGYVADSLDAHIRAAATGTAAAEATVEITPAATGGAELVSIDIEGGS